MKGNCGECERRWMCEIDPDKCDEWPDPLPMTNADRIRAMTDEELAELFHAIVDDGQSCTTICDNYDRCKRNNAWEPICKNHYLNWLQQPCGGADHG